MRRALALILSLTFASGTCLTHTAIFIGKESFASRRTLTAALSVRVPTFAPRYAQCSCSHPLADFRLRRRCGTGEVGAASHLPGRRNGELPGRLRRPAPRRPPPGP